MSLLEPYKDIMEIGFRWMRISGRLGIITTILGVFTLSLANELVSAWAVVMGIPPHLSVLEGIKAFVRLFGFILLAVSIMIASARYLRLNNNAETAEGSNATDDSSASAHPIGESMLSELLEAQINRIIDAAKEIPSSAASILTEEDRNNLGQRIVESLSINIPNDVVKAIEDKLSEQMRRLKTCERMEREYEKTRSRLRGEILNLAKRGNLNLLIGIFMSLIGIIFLGWSLASAPSASAAGRDLVAFFVPRTSFVILIEIFAFFFLNLYRATLGEIKYFQNEITNVESKVLAVETVLLSDNAGALTDIAKKWAQTERNFILKKGETTLELEGERLGQSFIQEQAKAIKQILDFARKNKDG